ncbi:MAG: tripartite tricarboxylate transporter permease [Nanoarchaeota archaeon]|nr:tripartite tricarboxylate transporter permease [Nanoarchaeota archaeon]
MLLQLIIATCLGILAGTISGLLPGIHINLVGASLVALSGSIFSPINTIYLVVFIVAMSITHTFLDFIPSVFLGAPDTDTQLSVLPGHQLLKKGQGYEAVVLTAYGGLAAIFSLIFLSFPLIFFIPKIYNLIKNLIPFILILVSCFMIFSESKKFSGFLIFFLSGIFGLIVLNLGIKEPLLPLFSGLFGASSLLLSVKSKTQIPKQEIKKKIKVPLFKPLLGTIIASPLCGFLPGLGSGQAAILGNIISRTDRKGFLVLLGATNTIVMGFSFLALYSLSKTRTGSAVAVENLIGEINLSILILILAVCLISGIISFFLTIQLAKFFSQKIEKINYTKLSIFTLIFVSIIVLIFSDIVGFVVFVASAFLGIYAVSLGVRRTLLMACLLVPTIILYLG